MRETMETPVGNNILVRHPDDVPAKTMWQKTTVLTLQAGQPRPYADSVYEYEITFEGGSPSSFDGWDLPFGTMPSPESRTRVGGISIGQDSQKAYIELLKSKIKGAISHPWKTEKDAKRMGQPWLETLTVKESEKTHTTYRVVVVDPFMD